MIAATTKKSILEQFARLEFDDEAQVICPDCKLEIGQWYDEAMDFIEKGLCPICACTGIGDMPDCEFKSYCEDNCPNYDDCVQAKQDEEDYYEERNRELLRHQCYGSLSYAERSYQRI